MWQIWFVRAAGYTAMLLAYFCVTVSCHSRQASGAEPAALAQFRAAALTEARDYDAERVAWFTSAAEQLESWYAEETWSLAERQSAELLARLELLLAAKRAVDDELARMLTHRRDLAGWPADTERATALRQYLVAMAAVIRLSGQLSYATRDAVDAASAVLDPDLAQFAELVERMHRDKVAASAAALAYTLFDPPPDSGATPYPDTIKSAVLELIATTQPLELVPTLADYLRQPGQSLELRLRAGEVLWQLGLPQQPRPGSALSMPPAMTAGELFDLLSSPDWEALPVALVPRREALRMLVAERRARGITSPGLRLGPLELLPGDWFLMRNPSPYNHFTDLGPGLFTHVGIVAEETDETGIRRIVIVDLPERGAHIPATNAELYLAQTLHYVILRHRDPQVRRTMGLAAHDLIGNECRFDMLFDTARVERLRGLPLDDQLIHTYCAGLLLICAQATGQPRESFFPIREGPPGEQCLANLARLGMSIGDNFVSPTGPLFSPAMEIVGTRPPHYDPGREVKEAVYDHFAARMIGDTLEPAPDAFQQLREKVAGLSRTNEWLRLALARANNVSAEMDLESAARAAAVVETLDEIADAALREFEQSRIAVTAPSTSALLEREDLAETERKDLLALRQRHADLVLAYERGELTPRALRKTLVDYYRAAGRRALDERFFPGPP